MCLHVVHVVVCVRNCFIGLLVQYVYLTVVAYRVRFRGQLTNQESGFQKG